MTYGLSSNFGDFTWLKFSNHNPLSPVLKDQKLFLSLTGRVPLIGGNIAQEGAVCSSKGQALQFAYGLDFLSIQAYRLWIEYPSREKDERSLVIKHEIGDRRGEAYSLHGKAVACDTLGDREEAIDLLEAALEIFEQIENPWAKQARETLARWRGQ